jgi:hypothetical protein
MFLLLLACFAWTASLLVSTVVACCARWAAASRFRLKSAELLVVGSGTQQGHAVDVTQEVRAMPRTGRLDVLPRLMRSALRGDVRDALARCDKTTTRQALRRLVRRVPMCYLDVRYKVGSWCSWRRPADRVFRCLYPIYAFDDFIVYPPRCPANPRADSSLVSATLTLRHKPSPGTGSVATRQVSCQVTDSIVQLAGPYGDFHRHNNVSYQLRRHILQAVLRPEIWALTRTLGEREEEEAAEAGAGAPDGNRSSDSFKRLPRPPTTTLRFQIRMANKRVEVLALD